MSNRTHAKYKVERRLGVSLWGGVKSPYARRSYGPGQHGRRRKKVSDYGAQLRAKQMLRLYYGNIGERAFRHYYAKAVQKRGDSGENLVGLLERRLDAVVYRAKFAPTVFAARQLVSHGHVLVNGRRVTIKSQSLREGDCVQLRAKSREIPMVLEAQESGDRAIPDYIAYDEKKWEATLVRVPLLAEIPYPVQMEPHVVVAFYSR